MVSVIFPAAGKGRRMGMEGNKIFLSLAGVPILVRTLRKFSLLPEVRELIVVVGEGEEEAVRALLQAEENLAPWRLVQGGSERQYSVWNAVQSVDARTEIILVHDAVRPLVSAAAIRRVIAAARECGGAVAAVQAKNTVKIADAEGFVVQTPARERVWEVQTPQGFRREILIAANEKALQENFLGTDDASLVERCGVKVKLVAAEYANIKITTAEDLPIAEALLRATEREETA